MTTLSCTNEKYFVCQAHLCTMRRKAFLWNKKAAALSECAAALLSSCNIAYFSFSAITCLISSTV